MSNEEDDVKNSSVIRIPRDRIGALVGKEGKTKSDIEEISGCTLDIDSTDGDILVIAGENTDPLKVNVTAEVVKAIGRGFSPERALFLYNDGFQLIVISLREFARKGSNRINEIKGRIIGRQGKTRQIVEDITDCFVCVYGDTVSLIGDYISMKYAIQALQMIIEGKKQRTVYTYLESKAKELKQERVAESFG
ncbi:MAG: KH domain-containing protein [Candidatus Thermoplasmatota archaeon]|nr:KH domain-containing protein [Candidatus Thermoplasmatota archaeon]